MRMGVTGVFSLGKGGVHSRGYFSLVLLLADNR